MLLGYWPFKRFEKETIENLYFAPGVKVDFDKVRPSPPFWVSLMRESTYRYHVQRITARFSPELGRRLSQPEVDSLSRLAGEHVTWWSRVVPTLAVLAVAPLLLRGKAIQSLLRPVRSVVKFGTNRGFNADAIKTLLAFGAFQSITIPYVLAAHYDSHCRVLEDPELAWYRNESNFDNRRGFMKWRSKYVPEQWQLDLSYNQVVRDNDRSR